MHNVHVFPHDHSLIFPKMRQCNLPEGRVYVCEDGTHAGAAYPSITRVLGARPKPFLDKWRKKVGAEEADRITRSSGVQGTAVHKAGEQFLNNEPVEILKPHHMELWIPLRSWLREHVTKVYCQEQDVVSHLLQVAGRMDVLADIDNVFSILDLKTSRRAKKDEWVQDYYKQSTFYACAVYEITGRMPKQVVFPVSSPDGLQVFRARPIEHLDGLMESIDYYYANAV